MRLVLGRRPSSEAPLELRVGMRVQGLLGRAHEQRVLLEGLPAAPRQRSSSERAWLRGETCWGTNFY